MYDLITVHALERAIGVDAELILAFALFPHLALVNVLENIIFIVWLREGFKNPSHGICPLGGYPPPCLTDGKT